MISKCVGLVIYPDGSRADVYKVKDTLISPVRVEFVPTTRRILTLAPFHKE